MAHPERKHKNIENTYLLDGQWSRLALNAEKTLNFSETRNVSVTYMPPWCKIQVYLVCRSKTCTKQVSKGIKYIKWTTHWAQKSGLTLTFKQVTWKSIGIIYSLRATTVPSLVLIKWKGQKILSGQHLVYRRTDRHTDRQLQNNMPPFSRGA